MDAVPKEKIIRDAVHGYIHIDIDYFKIIDTPNFQRLKRLEQTNTRPLYPCAHHDRFVHSLGVYHLGKMAFKYLMDNSIGTLSKYQDYWDGAKTSFEIACLLHDIGHAPFSHTFEDGFDRAKDVDDVEIKLIDSILSGKDTTDYKINDASYQPEKKQFIDDYQSDSKMQHPHEKVGAILVLTEYFGTIANIFDKDPFLIARMILGLKYSSSKKEQLFCNCFIDLLNGETIDVDKLDYLVRDQWATGHVSKLIDYELLFSSMYIKENDGKYLICYHKKCINELFGLIETKKMLTVKMYSHHTVKYCEYLLTKAIEDITGLIDNEEGKPIGTTLSTIFSLDSLNRNKPIRVNKELKITLITDDDIIYLLKLYMDKSTYAKEWFDRIFELKAVWKTYSDYKYFFTALTDEERGKLAEHKEKIIEEFLEKKSHEKMNNYIEPNLDPEYNPNLSIDIKIFIKDEIVDFKSIRNSFDLDRETEENKEKNRFFLAYLPKELVKNNRKEFIEFAIQQARDFSEKNI